MHRPPLTGKPTLHDAHRITPTPHDAEEQLRPYLGRLYEAQEQTSELAMDDHVLELHAATTAALDKALDLLGVRR